MQHTVGVLFNAETGYALDAGVIFILPGEGTVVLHHEQDMPHLYAADEFPQVRVLQFEFVPN